MTQTEEQKANEKALWDDFWGEIPCDTCVHDTEKDGTCKAFPEGIPSEILSSRHDHHRPHPLDKGIQYEPVIPAKSHWD